MPVLSKSDKALSERMGTERPRRVRLPGFCGCRLASWLACLVAWVCGPATVNAAGGLTISWTNNMLSIQAPNLPGEKLEIWYLEAFCRSGSTHRDWGQTTIPHTTVLLEAAPTGKHLRLRTRVEGGVEVNHDVQAGLDEVDFTVELRNPETNERDVQWFQPCMRVARFTGRNQTNYIERSFIFTRDGLTTLGQTRRTEEARYRGGQVYVPTAVPQEDVNPRPLSPDRPVNGLIGCFSEDGKWLLATAWDHTQELFQGVIVCLHSDPRVGGLKPGESKKLHGKVYWMPNRPAVLLERYRRDFPEGERNP